MSISLADLRTAVLAELNESDINNSTLRAAGTNPYALIDIWINNAEIEVFDKIIENNLHPLIVTSTDITVTSSGYNCANLYIDKVIAIVDSDNNGIMIEGTTYADAYKYLQNDRMRIVSDVRAYFKGDVLYLTNTSSKDITLIYVPQAGRITETSPSVLPADFKEVLAKCAAYKIEFSLGRIKAEATQMLFEKMFISKINKWYDGRYKKDRIGRYW